MNEIPSGYRKWAKNYPQQFDRSFELPERISIIPENTLITNKGSMNGVLSSTSYEIRFNFLKTVMPISRIKIDLGFVFPEEDENRITQLVSVLDVTFKYKELKDDGSSRNRQFTTILFTKESKRIDLKEEFAEYSLDVPSMEFSVVSITTDDFSQSVILGS